MPRYIGVFEKDIEAETETDALEQGFELARELGLRFQSAELDSYQGQ